MKRKKHIALGIAVKGITGSKNLVSILNRFGHCLNYNCLEELETAIGSAIQDREAACPEGTVQDLPFGVAFDNFDELTETLSGSDTLLNPISVSRQSKHKRACCGPCCTGKSQKTKKKVIRSSGSATSSL